MITRSSHILILLLLLTGIGLAQISIDAQKDLFYTHLKSPEDGFLTISHNEFLPFSGPKARGDADLSAQIWTAWDSTYLYIYSEVKDDIIRVNNNGATYNDCLEIKIDPDPGKKSQSGIFHTRLTALDSNDADNIQGVDNLYSDLLVSNPGWVVYSSDKYARRITANGYVLELCIAWERIRVDDRQVNVGVGNIFGLAINIHDNDSDQRDRSIQWSAGMADEVWTTPQILGSVEFLPDNKLKLIKQNSIDPAARPGTTYLSSARFKLVPGSTIMLENWKYHPGDDPAWIDPAYDDSDWETTTSLLYPAVLPESGWDGTGCFRIHIVVDSSLINRPLGLYIWQAGASQIYLDGKLIYTFGMRNDDWTGLPKVITFSGKQRHVLVVRYSNLSIDKFHDAGYNSGFYIQLGNVNQMAEDRLRTEGTFIGFQMFLTSLPLAIGLLHLILFVFSPGLRQNLYFSLYLFAYAATIFFDYQILLSADIGNQLLSLRIHSAMLPFWIVFQLRFLYSLFNDDLPIQFWIISLAAFLLAALAIYNPGQYFGYFNIVHGVLTIEIIRIIVMAIIKKTEGAWIIALAYFVFFIFGMLDALVDAGKMVFLSDMQNPYAFGSISFFIAMSIYLSRDFARSNKKIAEQQVEQKLLEAENVRQAKELEEARNLQLSMLPNELPQLEQLEIGVFMKTATEVGGDYYDFHLADDGTLTIAIGDATGHGMKAGTMVASMKSLFGTYDENSHIPDFFTSCSNIIKRMKLGNLYMAMLLVKISGRKMIASAAGMPPIFIYRGETETVEEIVMKGMPLGGPAGFSYLEQTTDLKARDTILLMSDGLPELFNEEMEMLDYPRVKELFKEAADKSPDEIISHLNESGEKWRKCKAQDDDITFVVVKLK